MKDQRLYSASQIAEFIGISRQAAGQFLKRNAPESKVGTKFNVYDPIVEKWMNDRGVDVRVKEIRRAEKRLRKNATRGVSQSRDSIALHRDRLSQLESSQVDNDSLHDLPEYGDMTLNDIVDKFGSLETFREHLQAKKLFEDAKEKELKNKKHKDEVIDREFVKKYVFGLIEELTTRLLVDSSVAIATKVYAQCESGDTIEEATKTVREEISKPIKAAKSQIKKRME